MESPYDKLLGVAATVAGYIGGRTLNPTYEDICTGATGHAEAVEVAYDPEKISYEKLLETFWRNIDPTTRNRQFADRGTQYRTAIFYHDARQKEQAEKSKVDMERSGRFDAPIVTEIVPATVFYPAEDYHQDYYKKNSVHYQCYRDGSGRTQYLKKIWGEK